MPNTSLLFGPPGTGKTSTLKRLIEKSVEDWGYDRVTVCSFSKAATRTLVERDLPIPESNIGTLHALAYRAIGRPKLAEDKEGLAEWNKAYASLRMGGGVSASDVDEGGVEDVGGGSSEGEKRFAEYQLNRARMIPREAWHARVVAFAKLWEDFKRQTGRIDFTDMIDIALHETLYAPGSPSVIYCDEAQDLNRIEAELILKWSLRCGEVIFALDDDQAIYHFTGADPRIFLEMQDVKRGYLRQSWRVPRKVLDASVRWIAQVSKRESKDYKPRPLDPSQEGVNGPAAEGDLRYLPSSFWMQPKSAIRDAERYLSDGMTVMFLASCSYMLEPLKAELREQAIPFENEYRRRRGDWNPLAQGSDARKTATDRLLSFLLPDEGTWGDGASLWSASSLSEWIDAVQVDGVLKRGAKTRLKEHEDPHREMTAGELMDLFATEEHFNAAWNGDLAWLQSVLLPTKRQAWEYPIRIAERRGGAALRRDSKKGHLVKLGTIHSVKGGEANAVYLWPDLSRAAFDGWVRRGEERDSIVRTFYVGMTRASDVLVLCGGSGCGVTWRR